MFRGIAFAVANVEFVTNVHEIAIQPTLILLCAFLSEYTFFKNNNLIKNFYFCIDVNIYFCYNNGGRF